MEQSSSSSFPLVIDLTNLSDSDSDSDSDSVSAPSSRKKRSLVDFTEPAVSFPFSLNWKRLRIVDLTDSDIEVEYDQNDDEVEEDEEDFLDDAASLSSSSLLSEDSEYLPSASSAAASLASSSSTSTSTLLPSDIEDLNENEDDDNQSLLDASLPLLKKYTNIWDDKRIVDLNE